ncbi:hypothetical protein BDF21DRAFT_342008 [Thamnidium elegans]|nr:hypothetical protein BDF21DRAFT_342008 [Thamnidium elegans]
MMSTREPAEIERDISNIDSTLLTVSEIRSSLKYFTKLVQSDKKGPNFVHLFSDRLNAVKRDLNTLSSQGENLKGSDFPSPFMCKSIVKKDILSYF